MTSKTFKSAVSEGRLSIKEAPCGLFTVGIRRGGVVTDVVDLAPSDAPALTLTILEKSGYGGTSVSPLLMQAFDLIKLYVKDQERITAEAKEQAELEAEALELRNTCWSHASASGVSAKTSLKDLTAVYQEFWISMARKAREMAKEDNHA